MNTERAGKLARLAVPAAGIGVLSALGLIVISVGAERLQELLWDTLPDALGVDGFSTGWILATLTAAGLAVGLVVLLAPGHAGPDPATQGLVEPPLPLRVLPGLAVAVIVGLAGGVSLGPENPLIAINVALAVWIGHRISARVPVSAWAACATAGTIGAMFGSPVGAALLLSEAPNAEGGNLWDRMFAPLVAAATGALTMDAFSQPILALDLARYPGAEWLDLLSAPAIGLVAAASGLVLVYAFPYVHAAFAKLRSPLAALVAGGFVLGALGVLGGEITLFKGLDEMKELVGRDDSTGELVLIVAVKLAALLIAASCGFRGGRIFPAVFVGVAIGLLATHVASDVPVALAVGAGVLGILLVVTRSGWLSLFMAVTTVGQVELIPVLCIALLPVWLLVTDRPPLQLRPGAGAPGPAAA